MNESFFDRPILNSPYAFPGRHWELDADGQPTNRIIEARRRSDLITPVPKPKKRRQPRGQAEFLFDAGDGLSTEEQEYNPTPIINEVRTHVEAWRNLPNLDQWQVTPETARLLKHWRHHQFDDVRPFFCQIEAVETAIWLTEVAPKSGARGAKFWDHLKGSNAQANPELMRLALKLATGAGKTAVMAMLIAWQTVNAARHRSSKHFSRGFLIVAPGITIRDRLRVLLPNDPDSYYRHRELVPPDMLGEVDHAKIVITNFHAFKLRERLEVAKGTRAAIEGWRGEKLQTLETEGQMLRRVMPELMGMQQIAVINDEAHHCYRERVKDAAGETEADLKGEEKEEAKVDRAGEAVASDAAAGVLFDPLGATVDGAAGVRSAVSLVCRDRRRRRGVGSLDIFQEPRSTVGRRHCRQVVERVLAQPRVKRLLSTDHFSVDGTLIEAWASMKSFRPKRGGDEPPADGGGRNGQADFHGQRRSNETHASTSDPDARLYRKGPGKEAKLCFIGHALMENRNGLWSTPV